MGDRAQLNFDDDDLSSPPPPIVSVEKILEVTRRAGFHETPKAVAEPVPNAQPQRRTRLKTGRVKQFATRLHPDTVEAFHVYADDHKITVAETLERALKALQASEKASS